MKLKNIFISGLGLLALTACNDYLDVDAPSKSFPSNIYSSTKDVSMALNGVYAEILASNTFGQAYTYSLVLNSDVDFVSNSSASAQTNTPKRYDQTSASSTANSVWNATYTAIETTNEFIYYLSNSPIYNKEDDNWTELQQYMGEAKAIRAMLYNELICYWGDVPFTMEPTSVTQNFVPAITSRDVIARKILEDLIEIAPNMKSVSSIPEGVERISQEACWALIARIGLQAGGYSLRHAEGDATSYGYMGMPSDSERNWFLTTARDYAKKVIDSKTHSLSLPYQSVFLNECNMKVVNDDDVIFEIPFAIEASGSIGYRQGPKFEANGGSTNFQWGESGGNQQLEWFYRYSFKQGDMRRDAVVGWWYYTYDGIPKICKGYSYYNNKWSKLFNDTRAYSRISANNTGINYPYLRYADVLLMYAEADVKLTKAVNTDAVQALQSVRNRAYIGSTVAAPAVAATDSASFMDEILQERKWEFAGENMRWKDLVRNNQLSEVLYYTFLRYYATAYEVGGMSNTTLNDMIVAHDGIDYFGGSGETYTIEEIDAAIPGDLAYGQTAGKAKGSLLPQRLDYCWIENPKDNEYFANHELPTLYIFNRYSNNHPANNMTKVVNFFKLMKSNHPTSKVAGYTAITDPENPNTELRNLTLKRDDSYINWFYDADGYPRNQVLYSFYGFIRGDETDKTKVLLIRNGVGEDITGKIDQVPTDLPVVRYILPIPREAITRSEGVYKNYYGY